MPRILLIEDNDVNQDLVSRYLEFLGCETVVATNGQEGLEVARREGADLDAILLDMDLPVLDGWAVARQLKSEESTRSLPVIAVTAHAMKGDRERALAAGCDDYASKPIDFTELMAKIQTLSGEAIVS
jgi:CheY-like chemotaxis protein